MSDTLINLLALISRYVHIVATSLIVGGTLFFEMIVPAAIGELKTEVQLAIFGRMRWLFRWIVYTSAILLLITGAISIWRNPNVLNGQFIKGLEIRTTPEKLVELQNASVFNQPKWWFIAHIVAGTLSLLIAISLVGGGRPPERPLQWMRLNLFLLMLAIFLASASRGAKQNLSLSVQKDTTVVQHP